MSEEKEFEHKMKRFDNFKTELGELFKKYNIGKHEANNYDGQEEYCGTSQYFTINGEIVYSEEIGELIDGVIKQI